MHITKPATALGRFVRDQRCELHLTQAQLAEKLGLKSCAVSHLEVGRAKGMILSPDRVALLAAALRCSMDAIDELLPLRVRHSGSLPSGGLGRLLLKRRVELNVTQQEAAQRAGVARSQYPRWESGKIKTITPRMAEHIQKGLGLDASSLEPFVKRRYSSGAHMTRGKSKFARAVRARRLKLDLSQATLAARLGVTAAFVSQIEVGKTVKMTMSTMLPRLAKELGIPVSRLEILREKRKRNRKKRTQ